MSMSKLRANVESELDHINQSHGLEGDSKFRVIASLTDDESVTVASMHEKELHRKWSDHPKFPFEYSCVISIEVDSECVDWEEDDYPVHDSIDNEWEFQLQNLDVRRGCEEHPNVVAAVERSIGYFIEYSKHMQKEK